MFAVGQVDCPFEFGLGIRTNLKLERIDGDGVAAPVSLCRKGEFSGLAGNGAAETVLVAGTGNLGRNRSR